MTASLITLAAAALLTPPEVEPLYFKGFGRWQNPPIDAAVQQFYATDISAKERAELASSALLRPYLYQAGKRLGQLEEWEENAIRLALAASVRTRLKNEEFVNRIDLLMEAGIIAADKPSALGRREPAAAPEAFRQMQALLADLGANPVIDGYMARMEQKWKRRLPVSLTNRAGVHGAYFFNTTDELLRVGGSAEVFGQLLVGEKLQITDDRPSVYIGGAGYLLRQGINLRPNATTKSTADDISGRFFVCGDTSHLGPPFTMVNDQSVMVVDGDLTLPGYSLNDSLFIASGSIHIVCELTGVRNSWFIAGDTITASKAFDTDTNTFVAGEKVAVQSKDEKKPGVRIEDKAKADLGLNFFKSEEVGVTFDPKEIKAVVKAVADDSPFRHVLMPGDVVTAVNDREVRNEGAARRALREAVVLEFAFVTRTRGMESAKMNLVYLSGWPKVPAKKPDTEKK